MPINLENEKRYLESQLALARRTNNKGLENWVLKMASKYGLRLDTPTIDKIMHTPTHTNTGAFPSAGETGTPSHVTPPTKGIGQYMGLIVIGAIILLLKK
jgi:hypothetical protein